MMEDELIFSYLKILWLSNKPRNGLVLIFSSSQQFNCYIILILE